MNRADSITGESPEKGAYLMCEDADHCQDFVFSDIDLRTAVSLNK